MKRRLTDCNTEQVINLKTDNTLRNRALATSAVAALLATSACGDGSSEEDLGLDDFDGEEFQVIVPAEVGGGFDTTIRQLQGPLEDELGAQMTVQNLDGAATAIGSQRLVESPEDCRTVMVTGVPHLQFSYLTQDVNYDLDDFAPVAGLSIEPGVFRVPNDAPWDSMEDFVEDARENPGEINISVSFRTSSNYVGVLDLEEATGAEFNIVSYEGGGPSRTAVISGEVDSTQAGVFNSLSIQDDTRVLGVQAEENLWPDETDDAPTLTEALGTEVPENASNYTMWAPAGCESEYPERHAALNSAIESALQEEEYLANLEELGEASKVAYLSPEELQELAEDNETQIQEILDEDPDAFTD